VTFGVYVASYVDDEEEKDSDDVAVVEHTVF